jgi:hypothetical protein
MTRDDTIKLLAVLFVAYPKFYAGTDQAGKEAAANLWYDMLQEYPPDAVNAAMRQYIKESQWPPTIADIIKRLEPIMEQMHMMQIAAASYHAALAAGEIQERIEGGLK